MLQFPEPMDIDPFIQNAAKPVGCDGEAILLRMNQSHADLAAWGFSHVHPAAAAATLDIGCGGGMNLCTLLRLCPQGCATGVDYSSTSVRVSQKTNAASIAEGRCRVLQADVNQLPFPDSSFDLATAFETLYFWPDPIAGLSEIRRVLRPGGSILICHEADGSRPGDELWPQKIPGMRVYSAAQLQGLLAAAGFAGITTHTGPRQGWVAATAQAPISLPAPGACTQWER